MSNTVKSTLSFFPGSLSPGLERSVAELDLEPGVYVLKLLMRWATHGDVSYGFLVDVSAG